MNLYFRFISLLLKRLFVLKKNGLFDECDTRFRVNLSDLDVNFHMNNGRYLTLMDLGRIDLMLRAGVFWTLVTKGYYPVVASQSIRFKKSLEPFQAFELITQVESWSERDFFMSQKFMVKGDLVAEGYIRGRFKKRGQKGSVTTPELFRAIGHDYPGDKLTEKAQAQIVMDSRLGI